MAAAVSTVVSVLAQKRPKEGLGLPTPSVGGGGSFAAEMTSNEARNQGRSGRGPVVGSHGQCPQKSQNVSPDPPEGVVGGVGMQRQGKLA